MLAVVGDCRTGVGREKRRRFFAVRLCKSREERFFLSRKAERNGKNVQVRIVRYASSPQREIVGLNSPPSPGRTPYRCADRQVLGLKLAPKPLRAPPCCSAADAGGECDSLNASRQAMARAPKLEDFQWCGETVQSFTSATKPKELKLESHCTP